MAPIDARTNKVPSLKKAKKSTKLKRVLKGEVESPAGKALKLSAGGRGKSPPSPRMLIRILFLTYYASLGSLMPYLPVYYHSLGHGGLIIGMLGSVKPLTTFLVAPFWGIMSDRSRNRFSILYFTFLVSLVGQVLVAFRNDVRFLVTMVFVTAFFNAPVKSLIDGLVMDNLENKVDYGRLRLWGQLGFGLGSSGVGLLLHKYHLAEHINDPIPEMAAFTWGGKAVAAVLEPIIKVLYKLWMSITGYRILFLTHVLLSFPSWLCMKAFERLEKKKSLSSNGSSRPKKPAKIQEGLSLLLHSTDALLFFFLVFVVGTSSGLIENFAHVRIKEVGGGGREMGLCRLLSSLAGAPMFWFSGPLTELLGADRVLVLSLFNYVLRFLIYASMRNPYQAIPAEVLRGVTFAAFWSTGTMYAHRISPRGMNSTMLMFMNAMYGGLGQSVGAIIGGNLQSRLGTPKTFLVAACFDLCFVAIVQTYLNMRKESSFQNPSPLVPKR